MDLWGSQQVILVHLKFDVFIDFRTATFAFWNEVETDATDVFLGTEVLL